MEKKQVDLLKEAQPLLDYDPIRGDPDWEIDEYHRESAPAPWMNLALTGKAGLELNKVVETRYLEHARVVVNEHTNHMFHDHPQQRTLVRRMDLEEYPNAVTRFPLRKTFALPYNRTRSTSLSFHPSFPSETLSSIFLPTFDHSLTSSPSVSESSLTTLDYRMESSFAPCEVIIYSHDPAPPRLKKLNVNFALQPPLDNFPLQARLSPLPTLHLDVLEINYVYSCVISYDTRTWWLHPIPRGQQSEKSMGPGAYGAGAGRG
ncbi:hypothetical protein JCM5353_000115 [Sporobolomyces roseus]